MADQDPFTYQEEDEQQQLPAEQAESDDAAVDAAPVEVCSPQVLRTPPHPRNRER